MVSGEGRNQEGEGENEHSSFICICFQNSPVLVCRNRKETRNLNSLDSSFIVLSFFLLVWNPRFFSEFRNKHHWLTGLSHQMVGTDFRYIYCFLWLLGTIQIQFIAVRLVAIRDTSNLVPNTTLSHKVRYFRRLQNHFSFSGYQLNT